MARSCTLCGFGQRAAPSRTLAQADALPAVCACRQVADGASAGASRLETRARTEDGVVETVVDTQHAQSVCRHCTWQKP
eukprot:4307221-Pleurochrysis_carterae.AAC.1